MSSQFLKYVTLGSISNVVDFSILYILTESAGIHYLVSAALSFIVGVVIGYVISALWIFTRRRGVAMELVLVFILSTVGLVLNEIIIFVLVRYLSIHYMISKAISATIVMSWNFHGRKKWVFAE